MILVTGASGFVGQHVVAELLARGYPVRALSRQPHSPVLAAFGDKIDIAEGDVRDIQALAAACEGVVGIIHAAALVSFFKPRRQELQAVNTQGTANVVNAALDAGVKKLVFVSSIGALGDPDKTGYLHEGCKWADPGRTSWYGYTKYLAELEVHRGVAEGLHAAICNPSLVVGPGNWQQSSPALVARVAKGLRFYPLGGNGFVGVWDVARACALLLESPVADGSRFVLNAQNLAFHDFFSRMAQALGKQPPRWAVPTVPARMVGWLAERWAYLAGGEPLLTAETAASAARTRKFKADKFQQAFDFTFEPMQTVIERTANAYLNGTNR